MYVCVYVYVHTHIYIHTYIRARAHTHIYDFFKMDAHAREYACACHVIGLTRRVPLRKLKHLIDKFAYLTRRCSCRCVESHNRPGQNPVKVVHLLEGGTAKSCGRVAVDDILLEVDGRRYLGSMLQKCLDDLSSQSCKNMLTIAVVRHSRPLRGCVLFELLAMMCLLSSSEKMLQDPVFSPTHVVQH
jgi:hypothetical protein